MGVLLLALLRLAGFVLEEAPLLMTLVQSAFLDTIKTQPSLLVPPLVVTESKLGLRSVTMETLPMEMAVRETEALLKLGIHDLVPHTPHLMCAPNELTGTNRTHLSTQYSESPDAEMVSEQELRNETTETQLVEMDEMLTAHRWKTAGYATTGHPQSLTRARSDQQDYIRMTPPTPHPEFRDVEMD